MKCPYCVSEIDAAAFVCAVCRRDLYVVKPLLEKIERLEARLAALPEQMAQSGEQEAALEAVFEAGEIRDDDTHRSYPKAVLYWVLPLLLLVIGHWLMFFVYDLPVLPLRIFALILPLPFGFLFAHALRQPFVWGIPPAFLMAGCAVFAMGGVTAAIDGVPLLPQNVQELREFIEFSASIGFSFTTGLWLCHWRMRHDEQKRFAVLRAGLKTMASVDSQKLSEKLTRLNDLGSGLVTLITTGVALYTGLKRIIG